MTLVSVDSVVTSLGSMQEAHLFRSPSGCVAFLANYNSNSYAKVVFNNDHYSLPPWSISILPDCKNVVFNTATVGVQTSQMQMWADGASSMMWERYDEEVDSLAAAPLLTTTGPLERLNVTRDISDYLWHITSVDVNPSEKFLQGGKPLSLVVLLHTSTTSAQMSAQGPSHEYFVAFADTSVGGNETGCPTE